VLHQAFALTGDLSAAQGAVRDAYVAAWHHWRKVERLEDKEGWVRPHAWQLAQRRHAGRIWHRNKGLSAEHAAVLDGLAKLPAARRRALLLVQLAGKQLDQAARELGVTQESAERLLQAATAGLAVALDTDAVQLRSALLSLDDALEDVSLPRASIIRRAGQKRRQAHTVVAAVAATAIAVAAGAVAYQPPPGQHRTLDDVLPHQRAAPAEQQDTAPAAELPTAGNLLDQDQIRRLGSGQEWQVTKTHNNTSGDGINTICQRERFADPDGLSAVVRTFQAAGKARRDAVQTVEVSATAEQAHDGFDTTLGWYAGCQVARLQLLHAYQVDNIGDEAAVLMMRVWSKPVTTYSVAVARIGAVTTSTVGRTVGATPPPAGEITQSLADSVAMLCARSGSEGCAKQPQYRVVPPPPSGEGKGILAVADLPPVGRIDQPWVGTDIPAAPNPSMTTCDQAEFIRSGAVDSRARVYLIPQADLPDRFGLSETYGEFRKGRQAARFLEGVRARVAKCEDRDLATTVTDSGRGKVARSGATWSTWNLRTEVSERKVVHFRVGFVRVGRYVADLLFVSAPEDDMTTAHFRALVVRAGDRLLELD
jgi:DNA-directed RNA polymerase specialized sigma24 family protein